MPLTVVWEFEVPLEARAAFEERYGPGGSWARLFARSPGYQGTRLLRDVGEPGRYVTLDEWADADALRAFRREAGAEYEALDRECEALTRSERFLGEIEGHSPSAPVRPAAGH